MANTLKVLYRGAAATSSATLYTVPASTNTLVTSIVITNTAGTAGTYTLLFNDVSMATTVAVPANDSVIVEPKQLLATTQTIKGLASAITINFHITGLEIT
jgi:outer membrane protein W